MESITFLIGRHRDRACFRIALLLLAGIAISVTPARAQPKPDIESRIDQLLNRMTLEQKLGQMSQAHFPHPLPESVKDEIRADRWGSLYGGGSVADKAEAQRIALHESRLGIPLLFGQDVIHGWRTTFPIPLAQAASWDPSLVKQAARIQAIEASASGINWTFAPMMDIARDARWGRIAETLGEDPYLAGSMASEMVKGLQGDSLDTADAIAACGKHFVGYGAAEAGRDYNTTWIPESLLRDVYLVPFERAKDAGVCSFMSAFNDLNGVPSSANAFTLRQILRKEWGFDGVVVSDFDSVGELIPHGYAVDDADAALKAIRGGVDMEMVSTTYFDHAKQAVDSGALDIGLINDSVRNILRMKFRLGLFDGRPISSGEEVRHPEPKAIDVAEQLAAESLVLLKNDNHLLPLDKKKVKVAIIGPLAASRRDQLGSWDGSPIMSSVQTSLDAFRAQLGDARVIWATGLQNSADTSHDGFAAARQAAQQADVVLLFLGEDANMSGEARSRAFLDLPGAQNELVSEIAQANKPIVEIIMAGRPLTFHDAASHAGAIFYAWQPGTMGGPAIAQTILGDRSPSGHLPVTFPRTVGQLPLYYNHMNTGRPPDEISRGEKPEYTSRYTDVSFTPEYPFGFGLTYSDFQLSGLSLSANSIKPGESLAVSAKITNVGKTDATQTVQLYIRQFVASLTQPVRELKAFSRVDLKAGESRQVRFTLASSDLAFHDASGKLVTEPGAFQLWLCTSAESSELTAPFSVAR